ncbi:AI-2E family transporter [Candidatus Pantoea deserta]|uniref:AI-2E family transporter n=1 Tax=Candidatus Pantoea deserta TaxID=1869313 RepID=A0A3N4NXT3_9GAMM|nr:AI-2E family transporter [Pantoea deserta]RPE01212.1 AI-2E family transporter [Pantoea deserta]
MYPGWLKSLTPFAQGLFMLACLTLVLLGLYLAAPLVNQVLLALFLAVMLDPLISRLAQRGIPRIISSLLIIVIMLLLIVVTIMSLSASAPDLIQLSRQAPGLVAARLQTLTQSLGQMGVVFTPDELLNFVDAGAVVRLVTTQLSLIPGMLSWWLMVFLMLLFMLYELPVFKLILRASSARHTELISALEEGVQSVTVYVRVKTLTGLLGGIIVWLVASLLGLKFAFLWGVLMFILNYIPVLGSFLAALPMVIQSFILFNMQTSLLVAGFFVVLNLSLSSLLEPLMLGRRLNMSLTVQLLAFLFWQSLLGITGAILAIPLTYMLKKVWLALHQPMRQS